MLSSSSTHCITYTHPTSGTHGMIIIAEIWPAISRPRTVVGKFGEGATFHRSWRDGDTYGRKRQAFGPRGGISAWLTAVPMPSRVVMVGLINLEQSRRRMSLRLMEIASRAAPRKIHSSSSELSALDMGVEALGRDSDVAHVHSFRASRRRLFERNASVGASSATTV
jgi:hypothetical protein